MNTNNLVTNRVVVRPFVTEDAEQLRKQADNAEVARRLIRLPYPHQLEHAVGWIEKCQTRVDLVGHQFAIEVDGDVAGTIGFEPMDDQPTSVAEVGYWLGQAYWGRGLALVALLQLARIAREHGVRRFVARVLVGNSQSERVLEKAGFTRGEVVQNDLEKDGVALAATYFHLTL